MGISYLPVAKFGLRFKKNRELLDFLVAHSSPDFEDADDIREKVSEMYEHLMITPLDMFSTQETILGYNMALGETVDKYQEMWNKDFPNCSLSPTPILAVRTY